MKQQLLQKKYTERRRDTCIVFAMANYGPLIEVAIMYDFGLDDSNQEDTVLIYNKIILFRHACVFLSI